MDDPATAGRDKDGTDVIKAVIDVAAAFCGVASGVKLNAESPCSIATLPRAKAALALAKEPPPTMILLSLTANTALAEEGAINVSSFVSTTLSVPTG